MQVWPCWWTGGHLLSILALLCPFRPPKGLFQAASLSMHPLPLHSQGTWWRHPVFQERACGVEGTSACCQGVCVGRFVRNGWGKAFWEQRKQGHCYLQIPGRRILSLCPPLTVSREHVLSHWGGHHDREATKLCTETSGRGIKSEKPLPSRCQWAAVLTEPGKILPWFPWAMPLNRNASSCAFVFVLQMRCSAEDRTTERPQMPVLVCLLTVCILLKVVHLLILCPVLCICCVFLRDF